LQALVQSPERLPVDTPQSQRRAQLSAHLVRRQLRRSVVHAANARYRLAVAGLAGEDCTELFRAVGVQFALNHFVKGLHHPLIRMGAVGQLFPESLGKMLDTPTAALAPDARVNVGLWLALRGLGPAARRHGRKAGRQAARKSLDERVVK